MNKILTILLTFASFTGFAQVDTINLPDNYLIETSPGNYSPNWEAKKQTKQVSSNYVLTANDGVVICNSSCTITIPSILPDGFKCRIIRAAGTVTLAGEFLSPNAYTRLTASMADADVHVSNGKVYVTGKLSR